MGRHKKIPGKRHHGVKDPEQQQEKRRMEVKKKSDLAPSSTDDQEMPRKLRELLRQKELMEKRGAQRKQIRRSKEKANANLLDSTKHMGFEMRLPGMKRPLKPIPVFKQEQGETKKQFFNRMEMTVRAVIRKKQYEDKYKVEMVTDERTGEEKAVPRPKDDLELERDEKRRQAAAKKGIVLKTKEEKRQLKRLREKEKRLKKKRRTWKKLQEEDDDIGNGNAVDGGQQEADVRRLDDVVHCPPDLRHYNKLHEMKKRAKNKVSLARQAMLEGERQRVVEAYRQINKSKLNAF